MAFDLDTILVVGGAIGAALAGMGFGKKAGATSTEAQATVLAGSISDPKLFRELLDALDAVKGVLRDNADQRHRDDQASRDAMDSLTRAVRDNTEAVRSGTMDPRMFALLGQLKDAK